MTTPNYGDVLLWAALTVCFFRTMGSGFHPDNSGEIVFRPATWLTSLVKAAIVVAPLAVLTFAEQIRNTTVWDALGLLGISLVVGPIAFPQLTVELKKKSFTEKVGHWLMSRFDIAVKKGLLLLVLSFVLSKFPLHAITKYIVIPHYFTPHGTDPTGPFTLALLVVAFLSLLLRAMITPAISKLAAFTLLPLAAMLVGYIMDLGGSLHPANVPVSLGMLIVAAIDLALFVAGNWVST